MEGLSIKAPHYGVERHALVRAIYSALLLFAPLEAHATFRAVFRQAPITRETLEK